MGVYLNPSNEKFQRSLNSKIYVDKSGLISYTNGVIRTFESIQCDLPEYAGVFEQ